MSSDKRDEAAVDRVPGEDEIAGVYRNAVRDEPPAALDAEILAAAHAALGRSPRESTARRWAVPLSVAAVIVLAVGVVLRIGVFDPTTSLPTESAPAAPEYRATVGEAVTADRAPNRQGTPATDQMAGNAPRAAREGAGKQDAPRASAPAAREESTPGKRDRAFQAPAGALSARPAARPVTGTANIVAVRVTGEQGAYRFAVGIRSADRGCRQYADWWEVVSLDGNLLYRQVFAHSHVGEQPFESVGGPVPIQSDTVVWIRAHMNASGYGGAAYKGSPKTGFAATELPADFAGALANQPPLPSGCAY